MSDAPDARIPPSMRAELGRWRPPISLDGWAQRTGSFGLAVGYADVFWPRFVAFEAFVLREGVTESALRGFADRPGATRASVERVMNHLHVADLHPGREDCSADKLLRLGETLRDIHAAKLARDFPERTFEVRFRVPENREDLIEYQLSF